MAFISIDWDDFIYLSLLIGSIGFGSIFRRISSPTNRKNVATILGVAIVFIVSGKHTVYPLICTLVNALIITLVDKRIVHKVSFIFSFAFLIFSRTIEYVGLSPYPNQTNLILMIMTLKMVGLAFEVHDAYKYRINVNSKDEKSYCKRIIQIPTITDVFHYGYCYLGVLAGPYYTYQTYCDLFISSFWKYANCESVALKRFMYLPVYGVIFLVLSHYFPFNQLQSPEFFEERSIWYRLFFSFPSFAQFRMRMYIGMILAEIVVIMGGLGAYPEISQPTTLGPTSNFKELTELVNNEEKASKENYNFVTVHSIEPYHVEFETTVRASMKYWNMTVQCWLTNYIYHRSSKTYRTLLTFVVSSVWHGMSPGYFFAFVSVALFLPIEDIYRRRSKLLTISPWVSTVCWLLIHQLKLYLFSYWTTAFRLISFKLCWNYLSSIYFLPTFFSTFVMYAISFVIFNNIKNVKLNNGDKVKANDEKKL